MADIDLNDLRRTIAENREQEQSQPRQLPRKVLVGPEGQIVLGRSVDDADASDLSEIQQGTFAWERRA